MALLPLLHYPDERLRRKAEVVPVVDEGIRRLLDDMLETMYEAPGIGLAAPQVDVLKRLIVIDISDNRSSPLCLVNPEIIAREGVVALQEGCLSVPGIYEPVERAAHIRIKALDRGGDLVEMEAEDLLAVCIQHEIDHLEGKLFVDYLTEMKRNRIRKRMDKMRRRTM